MGGMTRLLLLLWAGVTVSTAMDLHKRIVRGRRCDNNERHYHVKLESNTGDFCGGSLISNRWVLTAAHCSTFVSAYAGLHPPQRKTIDPVKITDPPVIFDQNHDIALLRLPEATQIQPVALPTINDCNNRPQIGNEVQIAGYGPTAVTSVIPSRTLQCATTKVVECPKRANNEHLFCGDTQTVMSMPGDSGGGVLFNNKIYGVISFGGHHPAPMMFMDVCGYLEWITNTINQQ